METLLQEMENVSDRRAIFLNCYMLMTRNMEQAIPSGEFLDSEWLRTFLDRFAEYYFDVLHRYDLDSPATPIVWHYVHKDVINQSIIT